MWRTAVLHVPANDSAASAKASCLVSAQCTMVNVAACSFLNLPTGCVHSAEAARGRARGAR